jgi:putative membrane protein
MLAFAVRTAVVAVALWVAVLLVPGIALGGGTTATGVVTLIVVALIFG